MSNYHHMVDIEDIANTYNIKQSELTKIPSCINIEVKSFDHGYYIAHKAKCMCSMPAVNNKAKKGDWLVYALLPDTGLHLAIGCFEDERTAISNAYLSAQDHIDIMADADGYNTAKINPIYYLEGGEDMGISITNETGEYLYQVFIIKLLEE